jgi:hypothetical protein
MISILVLFVLLWFFVVNLIEERSHGGVSS